jgi:hypothetical protein
MPTYTHTYTAHIHTRAYTAQITMRQDIGVLSSAAQKRRAPWFIGYASLPTCEQAGSRHAVGSSGRLGRFAARARTYASANKCQLLSLPTTHIKLPPAVQPARGRGREWKKRARARHGVRIFSHTLQSPRLPAEIGPGSIPLASNGRTPWRFTQPRNARVNHQPY